MKASIALRRCIEKLNEPLQRRPRLKFDAEALLLDALQIQRHKSRPKQEPMRIIRVP
jgi:hypothetical protein